ncbi:glucose PTS transporter transcription antiterminator GlcT [Selenihalanaerobacter shriftii]|uniref:Transcriptional antiterminator, BglG family n=1 Tax=Selenihalanaerobacter shriftii TaxID=142842 RepID=A0A1T4PT85_9FIRM|nr:PRD domain-containing protein [Selenihalanaerobacter shriftii]SJZ94506.1 transcriptional antiterminator, BglG family [Selenihalanaerobacter shriftii]
MLSSDQSSNPNYRIEKILNNNVILASINSEEEIIVIGKGLGFNSSIGDVISADDSRINKTFIAIDEENKNKYQKLVETVDEEVIGVTEDIIVMASEKLDNELDEHIHIALADHIQFALKRLNEGLKISNPFQTEIQTLYTKEYSVAKEAAALIEKRLEIKLPIEEVSFITLHLHAARNNLGVSKTVKHTSLIKEMVDIIEQELAINLTKESLNYARLITHLRFGLRRIEEGEPNHNPILDKIKKDFISSYRLAEQLALMIKERLNLDVSDDEIGYIALHLQRLKKNVEYN